MRESDTYQMILEEGIEKGVEKGIEQGLEMGIERGIEKGQLQGAVNALLVVGTARLGEPEPAVRARIESETQLAQVEEWLRDALQVESWSELPHLDS